MFNGCLVLLNGCLVLLNGCLMDVWWMFGGRVTHGNPQRLGPSPWFIPSAVGAQAPISQPRGLSRSRSRCASRCSNDGSQAMSCWYYLALLGMSCPSHLVVLCCPWCIIYVSLMYPDVLGSVLSCHMMPKFACRQLATTRYHWYHEFTMIRKWFAIPQISRYQFYIARLVPMTAVTNVRTTFQAEPSPQAAVHTPQGDVAARDISWDWRYRMI